MRSTSTNSKDNESPRVPLSIRLKVWKIQTIDRLKNPDESNMILMIITAVLGWITSSVAIQILITLLMYKIVQWTGHKMEGAWFDDVALVTAAVSGVLAYLPLLLLPNLKTAMLSPWPARSNDDANGSGSKTKRSTSGKTDAPKRSIDWKMTPCSIGTALLVFLLIQVFGWLIRSTSGTGVSSNDSSMGLAKSLDQMIHGGGGLTWTVFVSIFITVLVTPVLEELLFRGVVTKSLLGSSFAKDAEGKPTRTRTIMACLVGGLLFGLTHLIGASGVIEGVLTLLGMTTMGWLFGLLDARFKSVVPSVIAHVIYNAGVVLLMIIAL